MAQRIVKPAPERQREILDVAQRLFFEEGYEGTSVQQIIDQLGLSKGAFYHHFASKEAVLEALIDRLVDQGLEAAEALLDKPELSPVDKLDAFFAATRRLRADRAPLMRRLIPILWMDENLRLRDLMQERTIEATVPVLAQLIEEGRVAGTVDCVDPDGAAEMLLRIGTMINDALARLLEDTAPAEEDEAEVTPVEREQAILRFERRLALYEQTFNRTLGLPEGTISLHEAGFADQLLEA